MAQHGFFCFTLALIFALTTFALLDSANVAREKILEAKTIALSLEQSSLKRFELEQNADKAIALAMEKSIRDGKESMEEVKQSAGGALWELFEKEKQQSKEKIEFYSASASSEQYSRLGTMANNRRLGKEDLEENSKAILLNIKGHGFIAEYSVTGGILKNKAVFAIVENTKGKQLFIIPIDYSNKILVVR